MCIRDRAWAMCCSIPHIYVNKKIKIVPPPIPVPLTMPETIPINISFNFLSPLYFQIVVDVYKRQSLSIPFEKSILGISFGFTILFKIVCVICIITSLDGIKNSIKLIIAIAIFFVFIFRM